MSGLFLVCNGAASARQSEASAPPSPDDIRKATHFLENATFGPTAADILAVLSAGHEQWLMQQFALPESPISDGLDGNQVRNQLLLNMANGSDQLRQRMMFALSQIIVVSAAKTGSGDELIPWVRLLSRNAFGNYRNLLIEVTVSPTMGKYLDLAYSKKASATSSPNENYPRELLQLFTIGLWELNMDGTLRRDGQNQPIPTYDQQTIREFSRAMTGWTYPTQPGNAPANSNPPYFVGVMEPRTQTHDTGAKTLLGGVTVPAGQATTADMQAVIDNIFYHPNVPPFVATRLIRSLVNSNPSPGYIQRVASVFADNGQGVRGDLKAVLRAVLLDPEALRFSSSTDGRLKDPVLHILGLGRALGARITDPNAFMYVFSNLTQRVLTPSTVFSFYSPLGTLPDRPDLFGPEFQIYPPALAIQRANFIYGILAGWFSSSFSVDLAPFTAVAASPTTLVNRVDHALMFGRMSNELRQVLGTATSAVPASNPRERALGALYLAAISSEYAVSSDNRGDGLATFPLGPGPSGGAFSLTGAANGFALELTWQNPVGGTPTSFVLDVTGSIVISVPLGLVRSFSYPGVPPGTYTFVVRAVDAAGASVSSNPVTLTFPGTGAVPGPCTGAPQTPTGLAATKNANVVTLMWTPAATGQTATSYVVNVTGSFVGSFQTAAPTLTGAAGPGSYTVTVQAVNACGSSGPTAAVTISVP